MELNRVVTIFLSPKGQETLEKAAGIPRGAEAVASFYALETSESGLWVSSRRGDGEHWLLIQWDCILALDSPGRRDTQPGLYRLSPGRWSG